MRRGLSVSTRERCDRSWDFSRAAGLAISLASERSKSFKVRRAGFVYGRAEKTRARARARKRRREDSRKIRLSNGARNFVRERRRKRRRERVASGQEPICFDHRVPVKYTCNHRRRIFIRIVKLLYATSPEGSPSVKLPANSP